MTQVRLVLVSACALIDECGRVLLARRPAGKHLGGLWEFPGGKVELGENPEEALIRELSEELAISVKARHLEAFAFASHSYETFHLLMPLYVCCKWEGTPTALEHSALAWARPQQLKAYPLTPADIPLVAALCDRLPDRSCATKTDRPPSNTC